MHGGKLDKHIPEGAKYTAAILEIMGVSEIGRRCLFTSLISCYFGTGTISASFHTEGNRPLR